MICSLRPHRAAVLAVGALLLAASAIRAEAPRPPNIIFILADDLGYAEVGCYGQKKIKTPALDQMAKEGVRFTNFYCGNAVCAPSRCVLMTGKHPGHAHVRDNRELKPEGQVPLPADTVTVARLLKKQGYATAAVGKWGLGGPGSDGDPNKQGFDLFYGFNCQRHAHNHYPTYLWRNDKREGIDNDGTLKGRQFSHDLFEAEALKFIRDHTDRPFFLYVPFTVPHVSLQVPEDSLKEYLGRWDDPPYWGEKGYLPHPHPRAAYAAMVTRLDRSVGRILEQLKKLGLDENTIVLFSSDNGPAPDKVGGSDSDFFESAGPLRGVKGMLYEGGIRVPFIARWPGKIKPGRTCDLPAAFYDLLPTLCDLAGAPVPKDTDGLSIMPTLLEKGEQRKHEFLYWEFAGYGGQQAVRLGDWKGVRQQLQKGPSPTQLYNLADDPGEKNDVAAKHPDVVARIEKIMREQHTPSELFPLKGLDARAKADGPKPDDEAAAAIEKLGGSVERDDAQPDKPVVAVDFYNTKVRSAALVHVEKLSKLRELSLYFTEVGDEGLDHIKGLTGLQVLDLTATKVTDKGVAGLKDLTDLRFFSASYTNVGDKGTAVVKGMTKLETLKLANLGLSDAALEHVKGLTGLKALDLHASNVTDAGLEHIKGLTKLEELTLSQTKVTDKGLAHLKGMKKLKALFLADSKVTDQGVRDLQEMLPGVKVSR